MTRLHTNSLKVTAGLFVGIFRKCLGAGRAWEGLHSVMRITHTTVHVRAPIYSVMHTLSRTHFLARTYITALFYTSVSQTRGLSKEMGIVCQFLQKVAKPMAMIFHTHDQYGILFDPRKFHEV